MNKKGFTLVELSIVLVIIGLLIGGILAAQSMISTAKLQSAIRQIQQYDIAATNFETKYNGQVPGDSISFGCTSTGANTCGDGEVYSDTFLYQTGYGGDSSETFNFWLNLNQAGLLSEQFTGYPAGGFPSSSFPGDFTNYAPKIDYGKNSFLNAVTIKTDGLGRNPNFGNAWTIQANMSSAHVTPSMTNAEALALDTKLDDGIANTGNIQVLEPYTGPWVPATTSNCAPSYNTNLASNNLNCALLIKAQW